MNSLDSKIFIAQTYIGLAEKKGRKSVHIAWSGGKDSTVLLHIIYQMYGNKIPFAVDFGESRLEIPSHTSYIISISKLWKFNVHINSLLTKNDLKAFQTSRDKYFIKEALQNSFEKILQRQIIKENIKAILWGTRIQDFGNNQDSFMIKKNGALYIYPLFHFTELDIWTYIYLHKIPINSIYEKGFRNSNIQPFLPKEITFQRIWFIFVRWYIKIRIKLRFI